MQSSILKMVVGLIFASPSLGWASWGMISPAATAGSVGTVTPMVATPTCSPGSGCYTGSVKVTLACATGGATIRYTTNGSNPTASSSAYGGPIALNATTTLKAKAFKSGMTDGAVASASYSIAKVPVATPTFSPTAPTTFTGTIAVSISCATSGALIRYTTNGSDPTAFSPSGFGPMTVTLNSTTTLKAKAFKTDMTDSAVASATYTLVLPSVASFTGTPWPFPNASFTYSNPAWMNYLQANYVGYTPIYIYANGNNLDKVTAVSTTAAGYTISIVAKTASQLTLNIQGAKNACGYFDEGSPKPVANMPITFSYLGGSLSKNISPGVIPAFNSGLQAYGQCTWYAGYIARLRAGRPVVPSYSGCSPLSGNPGNAGFPTANSVLNASGKHMAFLENITSSSMKNADGSVTVTYAMAGSQYNASSSPTGWGSKSSFTTKMVVNQKGGLYTIMTTPTVIYPVTAVKQ